jgi:ubiquinone/menaquinone biosynthesis C-methylase UbiE
LNIEAQLQTQKDRIRKRLLKYTRKAFRMLPPLDKPRILDIGCGSGLPTLELARLTDGEITGIDIDRKMLDRLRRKIVKAGLSDRVAAITCSITDMKFPDESFDLIWAEGSISAVGFERGLREWKQLLKPGGYMAIHDERGNIEEKLEQIPDSGYELLGYFELNKDVWRTEYFAPLEEFIKRTRAAYANDDKALQQLHSGQTEIDFFYKYPERNSSVFFVLKRV